MLVLAYLCVYVKCISLNIVVIQFIIENNPPDYAQLLVFIFELKRRHCYYTLLPLPFTKNPTSNYDDLYKITFPDINLHTTFFTKHNNYQNISETFLTSSFTSA